MKTIISFSAAACLALFLSGCGKKIDCAKLDTTKCAEGDAMVACVVNADKCEANSDANICAAAKDKTACDKHAGWVASGSCEFKDGVCAVK